MVLVSGRSRSFWLPAMASAMGFESALMSSERMAGRVSPRPALELRTRVLRSAIDLADLRALEREVVHQPLRVEDEADHRIGDLVGVDGATGADHDQHHRAVHTNAPAVDALEIGERLRGH